MIDNNIKKVMSEKKMTGRELAKQVGITEPMVSYLIAGKLLPVRDDLRKICEVLGCKTFDLYQSSDLMLIEPVDDEQKMLAVRMARDHVRSAESWLDQLV